MEQQPHTHYSELISRYLSGNASPADVAELENWVLDDPAHKQQFMAFKKAWMLAGMEQEVETVPVASAWEQTKIQLSNPAQVVDLKRKPTQSRRLWLGLAAAVVALLVVSVWLFQSPAQDGVLFVEAGEAVQIIVLPDSSTVTLNQFASLRYTPVSESSPQRQIELKGDAFFDVARDEAHPFVIQTQSLSIEVLGTSFYVDARDDQAEVQVMVASGRVAVRSDDAEEILEQNEQAIFQKESQHLIKQANADPNYQALKTQSLVFKNATMEAVVFALKRLYHADISIGNEALKSCEYTFTFDQHTLADILEILGAIAHLDIQQDGQAIVISGDCTLDQP